MEYHRKDAETCLNVSFVATFLVLGAELFPPLVGILLL